MSVYFEDLAVGTELRTSARTVTEADLVAFAMHSGDWNPIHMDREHAKSRDFGRPVVHGMCGMSIMGGLIYATGWFAHTTVALLGFDSWRFVHPIFVGDTLHCRVRIDALRVTSGGRHGLVQRHLSLWNQEERQVQEGTSHILIELRATSQQESPQ
jgi:acyl dehydratase